MMMTDDELRGSMRKAADKRAQVGILAELNAVSEDQMRDKLTELGVAVPGRKPRTARVFDPEQVLALIGQGLTDAEISRRLGVNKQTVGDWDFLSTNAKDAEVVGTVYDPEVTGDDRA